MTRNGFCQDSYHTIASIPSTPSIQLAMPSTPSINHPFSLPIILFASSSITAQHVLLIPFKSSIKPCPLLRSPPSHIPLRPSYYPRPSRPGPRSRPSEDRPSCPEKHFTAHVKPDQSPPPSSIRDGTLPALFPGKNTAQVHRLARLPSPPNRNLRRPSPLSNVTPAART
jgi:hypothetical protein